MDVIEPVGIPVDEVTAVVAALDETVPALNGLWPQFRELDVHTRWQGPGPGDGDGLDGTDGLGG